MHDVPSPLTQPTLRDDLPRYPQQVQLLRVTATTVAGPSGVVQTAGSSVLGPTLYVAFTQQMRTDGLIPRDREPCLVDDVNGFGLTEGFYEGRLAGSHNSLPVYEVDGIGQGLIVVDLYSSTTYTGVRKIEYDSEPKAYDNTKGDYVFTWTPGTRTLRIRLNGHTGTRNILMRCTSGQLKARNYDFRNGLLKVEGAEVNDPG